MSQDTQELDRRIRAAHDLKGVVRTLKSLAAANLKPLQDAVRALEDYRSVLRLGAAVCLRNASVPSIAIHVGDLGKDTGAADRLSGAKVILAFGSDMGMVGAFNETVADGLRKTGGADGTDGTDGEIWSAGDRLRQTLADMGMAPASARALPEGMDAVGKWVEGVLVDLETLRESRGLRSLRLLRNGLAPDGGIVLVTQPLLPLDRAAEPPPPWPSRRKPEAVPDQIPLFADLAREELFTGLFLACIDSMACEALGRMEAMERAERNLDELQERLGSERNRMRQESISQELLDLGTAFEAVRAPGAGR